MAHFGLLALCESSVEYPHYHYRAVVMMVVLPDEHNSFDQKFVEFTLWERHGIKMIRRSLTDIAARGVVDPSTKALTMYMCMITC
jgi:hypothetical protein